MKGGFEVAEVMRSQRWSISTLRAMALSRRDPEEAADLIMQLADAVDGEIAARLRALANSLT